MTIRDGRAHPALPRGATHGSGARGPAGGGATKPPGTLIFRSRGNEMEIATADGWLVPSEVQPEKRRAMMGEYLAARPSGGSASRKPQARAEP